jgi:hypothetical protein
MKARGKRCPPLTYPLPNGERIKVRGNKEEYSHEGQRKFIIGFRRRYSKFRFMSTEV